MRNWKEIIQKKNLVYASSPEDETFRTWSLKKTTCNILFYEEHPLDNFDIIICNILGNNRNSLEEERIATILGFNFIDDFNVTPKLYSDKAEIEVFRKLIQNVVEWGLIFKKDVNFILTELGQKAFEERKKYKFYSGNIDLIENQNLIPLGGYNNYFPFYTALGVFSEITNKKVINYNEVKLEDVFSFEETDLIKQNRLQSNEYCHIYFSTLTKYFCFTSCKVDIRLFEYNGENYPIVFYKNDICLEATELLHKIENFTQKLKKTEWGLYLKILNDQHAQLNYQTLFPFKDLMDLNFLIKDKRLVWSDKSLFTFIAEQFSADQWFAVSNYCPIEILKTYFGEYKEKLDWTSVSLRIDDIFLIQNSTIFPWNFRAISSKKNISIEVLKILLIVPELIDEEWDWDRIMLDLDFEFIKFNIEKVNFELSQFTRTNIQDALPLISQYPSKNWDWTFISNEYDLSYILENISRFSNYLDLIKTLNRAFSSGSDIEAYCQSDDLKVVLFKSKENKLTNFSANQSKYEWSEILIDLLENQGYLTWESGNYALGFECNPYIEWTYELLSKYHSKIVTSKGFDIVSSKIRSTKFISDFIEFKWNWALISSNTHLINNSSFILKFKERLDFNLVLSKIDGESLELIFHKVNIFEFLEKFPDRWKDITEKISKEFILSHIDFNWDWQILTKRFCSTIKVESIGNSKWINKWDWKYITRNLDINVVLKNLDLYVDRWDWNYLSSELDKQFVLINLPEYNQYWNWNLLLTDRFERNDLELKKLTEVATCISFLHENIKTELWGIITRKFDYDTLEEIITKSPVIFHWDYAYFYNLSDFSPLKYLSEKESLIDWTSFSSSNSLNKSLKYDSNLFVYGVWINKISKLLKARNYKWDFKSLSKLDSVNWNSTILKIKTESWDWEYLSLFSNCFKKEKGFAERFNDFVSFIDFQTFSKRTDSDITEELISSNIIKNWNWEFFSNNNAIKFTIDFILEHSDKGWNWHSLSLRNDIKINNEFLLKLSDKNWNWVEISKRQDLVFSDGLISILYSKPLDWKLVSQNKSFVPNSMVLSFLGGKELDWNNISENPNLSREILWDYRENLNWKCVTANNVIDLSDFDFLNKYQNYLDWNFISKSKKFQISFDNLFHFKSILNWKIITERSEFVISDNLLEPFFDVLNWSNVSKSLNILFTEELIEKYRTKWDWQLLRKNPQIIERLNTTLIKYQGEFNCVKFLDQFESPPQIFHFTHLFNAIDIIKERKILSRKTGDGKFSNSAGNLVNRRDTAHGYARFYFRPQTPTQFYNECLGWDSTLTTSYSKNYFQNAKNLGLPKCPIPIFFKFDLKEVLNKMSEKCFHSTGNMQSNRARVVKINESPYSLQKEYLYGNISDAYNKAIEGGGYDRELHYSLMEKIKEYSQQEFLVEEEFDFSNLESFEIICYNDEHVNLLKEQLINDPICEKINSNDHTIFHRGNRSLQIYQSETEISIDSDYTGNAYFLIKGLGLKDLKILDSENIQKETETEIIAYPTIKFVKSDKPIEVYFVDTSIGIKRDWLIYKN